MPLQVSLFSSAFAKTPQADPVPAEAVLGLIKNGKWKTRIEELRKLSGEKFREAKKRLPAFTVTGVFSRHNDSSLVDHSGLVQVDIDDKDNSELSFSTIWKTACKCPHTFAAFQSPSGRGVKVIVRCNASRDFHSGSYNAAVEWFADQGLVVDKQVKSLSQLCFVSYDPDLFMNKKARIITAVASKETKHELIEFEEHRSKETILHECEEHWPEKFPALWEGDYSDYYDDPSRADHALILMLRDHCHSNELVAELFEESGLYREDKWPGRTRDYVFRSLKHAGPVKALDLFEVIEPEPGEPEPPKPKKKSKGWSFTPVSEVPEFTSDDGDDYIIKKILYKNSVTAIYGPPGSAKTFYIMSMGAAIARGEQWNGMKTRKGGVLYCGMEGKRGITKRLQALKMRGHLKDGDPFATLDTSKEQLNLMHIEHVDKMIEVIRTFEAEQGIKLSLLIVDTLARATAGGEENSAKDMGVAVAHAAMIQEATGCCVCLVHHSGKQVEKGMRGSNALLGGLDTTLRVTRHEQDNTIRVMKPEKQRDEEENDGIYAKLDIVVLGHDNDGDEVTTCLIRFLHDDEIPVKQEKATGDESILPHIPEEGITREELDIACRIGKGSVTRKLKGLTDSGKIITEGDLIKLVPRGIEHFSKLNDEPQII